MRSSFIIATFATAANLVSALPTVVEKRADFAAPPNGDIDILNYALTLEYLERKFYGDGLAKFGSSDFVAAGFPAPFYDNLKEVYFDEQTHVSFLAGALKDAGVKEATYSFPYTDAKSFVALASVLEGVGVSAYLGAAAAILNKQYLTIAGSILTVESRHSSYIRAALGESPFPKPFDTPLDFMQVYSLAAQFITGFPNSGGKSGLPFTAFPALALEASQYPYTAGSSPVTFKHAFNNAKALGVTADTPVYAVFFSGLDTYYVKTYITRGDSGDYKIKSIPGADFASAGQLPPTGQVYVVLSTADGVNTFVNDANTLSGVGVLEVLPPRH
ncbi:hypothetical protein BP5796_01741 [Coleophoma crateriformis]|uniref:Uncharacterized protein n=1 Tax=Coleophoma crateriformis TaxID=565419 RepID=A0A3D8T193_9HELO|nr:hypothetical protein BP5796_01741 [Coleophoma crateriformis]